MNTSLAEKLIKNCSSKQTRWDKETANTEKMEAKYAAFTALEGVSLNYGSSVLDIGGEEFYQYLFDAYELEAINLPDDMHDMEYDNEFDAVIAMHVLEHSPFPLYVLALIHEALKPSGWLYVALPTHTTDAFAEIDQHFTIMPAKMWERLFVETGFVVIEHSLGKFGNTVDWVEERFLCQRN